MSQLDRSNNTVNTRFLKASTDAHTKLAETVQNIHALTNTSILNESADQTQKPVEPRTQLINDNSSLLKIDTALEQALKVADYDTYFQEPTANEPVKENTDRWTTYRPTKEDYYQYKSQIVLKTNAELRQAKECLKKKMYITGTQRYEDFVVNQKKRQGNCMYTTTYKLARYPSETDQEQNHD